MLFIKFLYLYCGAVFLRNNKGETPCDVAVRFGKTACISLLLPHASLLAQEEEKKELSEDGPSTESVERAKERVERLQGQIMVAKTRLRELGGELYEDNEIELLKTEHQRIINDLESKLQFERERRENLEGDMDQLRRQLQHSAGLLQHYQGITSSSSHKV